MQFLEPAPNYCHACQILSNHEIWEGDTYGKHVSSHLRYLFWCAFNPSFWSELMSVFSENPLVSVDDPAVHADDSLFRDEFAVESYAAFRGGALEDETSAGVDSKCLVGNSQAREYHVNFNLQQKGMGIPYV